MIINIENKEITLKYSFRGFMIYEQITDKSFQPKGLNELITLFYCIVMASDKELVIDFDDFIEWLDQNPKCLNDFSSWLSENVNRENELLPKQNEGEEKVDGSKN